MPDWNHVHDELRRRSVTLLLLWEEIPNVTGDTHDAVPNDSKLISNAEGLPIALMLTSGEAHDSTAFSD